MTSCEESIRKSKVGKITKELNRPYGEKLEMARNVIVESVREFGDKTSISWSGGLDSTVVLHMVRQINSSILVVFNDTGIEHPETYDFIKQMKKEWDLNLKIAKAETTYWALIKKHGFPKQRRHGTYVHCCYHLKEKPMQLMTRKLGLECCIDGLTIEARDDKDHNKTYLGFNRMRAISRKIANGGMKYFNAKWNATKVHPIIYFRNPEIWKYIHDHDVPYCSLYDDGIHVRTGCMACTAFPTWRDHMAKAHPKLLSVILKKMGQQQISKY